MSLIKKSFLVKCSTMEMKCGYFMQEISSVGDSRGTIRIGLDDEKMVPKQQVIETNGEDLS